MTVPDSRFLSAVLLLKIDLDFKPPAKKVFKQVGRVVCRPRVLAFLFAFMSAGVFWGCMETFLFWHLEVEVLRFQQGS